MSIWRQLPSWAVLFCAGLVPAGGFAQDRPKVPEGYEDAATAEEAPARLRLVPADERTLLINARVKVAKEAVAKEAAAKRAEADQGGRTLLGALADAIQEDVDPNVRQMETQLLPQFVQLLKSELLFVRRTCKLNKEQLTEIARLARPRLKVAAREYAVAQNNAMRGRGRGEARKMPDPRNLVERQLAEVLKTRLPAELAEQYRQESDKRTANRKRAVVLNLVVRLDDQLVLTTEQREKLTKTLSSEYQDALGQWQTMLMHNVEMVPQIPDNLIVPLLDERQKAVWRETSKMGPQVIFGLPFEQNQLGITIPDMQEIDAILAEVQNDND
ncbi:MAG: hypothetical protein ABFD16_14030 [Thermoguttaceae bacterium]